MKILLLGGTRFLGRHLAEQALAAGHDMTLLHRGRSATGLFPQARHLLADRDGDLSVLDGPQTWDAVIDTSAYVPRQVRAVAARLAGRIGHYQMVSTISVYAEPLAAGLDESARRVVLDDPAVEAVSGDTYGGLKALCEDAAVDAFGPDRVLLPRPGLIVGPNDPTGRFSWWVQRLLRGGDVLAPGPADAPVQFIDVRDLAAWLLRSAGTSASGPFNLTGPLEPMTMGDFLEAARQALNPTARLCWPTARCCCARACSPGWACRCGCHRARRS